MSKHTLLYKSLNGLFFFLFFIWGGQIERGSRNLRVHSLDFIGALKTLTKTMSNDKATLHTARQKIKSEKM